MIRFVTGVPGAGKSLYTTMRVVEELRKTQRPIITNLPLRVEPWVRGKVAQLGLRSYLLASDGQDHDCAKRVHILQEEEVVDFWLWRVRKDGTLVKLVPEWEGEGRERAVKAVGGMEETVPCIYVIDEAWQYFGARQWQSTGRGVLWYMAQHRKCGDDVWITTQHYNQVDKQLRLLVAEYHECINHYFRKMYIIRHPGRIRVAVSNDAPERQGRLISEEKYYKLDRKGLCSCYDTASGAGVAGASADIGKRAKGLPWWTLIIAVVAVLVFMYVAPDVAAKKLSASTQPKMPKIAEVVSPASTAFTMSNMVSGVRSSGIRELVAEGPPVVVTGVARMPWGFVVLLSDGDVIRSDSGRLGIVCSRFVVVDGRTNYYARCLASDQRFTPGGIPTGQYNPAAVGFSSESLRRMRPSVIRQSVY